ncbi:conserved hypothetical protein [Coccidioides posadasii str. Silveira]|uniref:Uncharacterized protein n=2 Tax=Coccidioides posadasii TaxID=199306 RepID=E9D1Y0_COCPS|nr:conserved hypothetical protein [Coccidioides posadasii str. Silveira]KMM72264.1 hypothetical protein CPAG_08561 [Coccidioides posadasii RMSCC 3488]
MAQSREAVHSGQYSNRHETIVLCKPLLVGQVSHIKLNMKQSLLDGNLLGNIADNFRGWSTLEFSASSPLRDFCHWVKVFEVVFIGARTNMALGCFPQAVLVGQENFV